MNILVSPGLIGLWSVLTAVQFVKCDFQVQCYLPSWSLNNEAANTFRISDIPLTACDVIIYAFFHIHDAKLSATDGKFIGHFAQLNVLKKRNPALKIFLGVGGANDANGTTEFSQMASSEANRTLFAASVVANLRRWELNGVDIDWEYPLLEEKDNFIALLKELRNAFDRDTNITKRSRLGLSTCVGATVRPGYFPSEMAKIVDVVNVMAYDYHGTWEKPPKTGYNAAFTDIQSSMVNWSETGIPKARLSLGLPFYGRTWSIAADTNGDLSVGKAALGPGPPWPMSHENGTLNYGEICAAMKVNNLTDHFDSKEQVPYATGQNLWVSYDDSRSLKNKVLWAMDQNYQGVFIWQLGQDDIWGKCGPKFGLLKAISQLIKPVPQQPVTEAPTVTVTVTVTEPATTVVPGAVLTTESIAANTISITGVPKSDGSLINFSKPLFIIFFSIVFVMKFW